jgi:signal peptidase I
MAWRRVSGAEVFSMGTNADAAQAPPWWLRVLIGRRPKRTLVRIVILVAVCFLGRAYVLVPVRVQGPSMLPTYKDRGVNIVNRLAYAFHEPQRGDVVAIRLQAGEHIMYMKRIVGLPGETVAFHQGYLYINGKRMEEPYVKLRGNWEHEDQPVGLDEYYVVGDNREMARRDHEQGRPTRDHIIGKLLL